MDLEIRERDEAGNLTATYIGSSTDQGKNRLDIITHNLWTRVLAVFLPAGYPHSVTEDYMWYQIYDSLQAFSSSIAGLLSSRAVLQGVGVGDASANPTTALLLSILQESTGRIATILFADRLGTSLSPECKMYRLAADIFNDAAMLLDCLSPALPRGPRTLLLSSSSVLRALCGVTAGSSKASLSAHFAKWGNLGELNAKDSSQETIISLIGMLAGSVLVSYVSSPMTTWSCLLLLLSIHLAMNRAAVRAVSMHTLNGQRANIVFSTFLDQGTVLSPKEVSLQERIFEWDGVLRWRQSSPLASAKIGHPLKDLLASLAPAHAKTGSIRDAEAKMMRLIRLYSQEEFLLWYDAPQRVGHIALKEGAAAKSQLKAWALTLWITQRHRMDGSSEATSASFESTLDLQRSSLQDLSSRWSDCIQRLRTAGWDIDVASLETTSGSRICVQG
ncbi:MAG: hypothetical protein L6R37_006246 [Teloschistes peruensis]|nr:MAG: hypothetical protein L6R37_006246 [Teloschistes peruensis]